MKYQTPQLSVIGSAQSLVLGSCEPLKPITNRLNDHGETAQISRDLDTW